jgi:hypothetical protein
MSWESRHKEGIGGTASCSSIVKDIIIPVLLRFSKLDDAITVVAAVVVVVVDVALMFDVHARSWAKLDL